MPPKIKRNRLEMKRILRYTIHSIQEKRATLRQERKTILIAADGSGDFATLTAAARAFGTVNAPETLQKQLENLTALRAMFDVEG